jgi:hypothetical protein
LKGELMQCEYFDELETRNINEKVLKNWQRSRASSERPD